MTYAFFAPKDLREVDPRPAPSLESESAVVRELLTTRLHGDELTRALQALGLEEYDRAFNPAARDAWTRKPTKLIAAGVAATTHCKHGHLRTDHTYIDTNGTLRCRECRRISDRARKQQEREKAAA